LHNARIHCCSAIALAPFDAFNRAYVLVVVAITADDEAVVTLVVAEIADGNTDVGLATVA
jgi:hypothetical protein